MIGEKNIQLANLPEIDEIDKSRVESLLCNCYDKLSKIVDNKVLLKAAFKDFRKAGAKTKHEVHLHFSAPGLEIMSSGTDWNLLSALEQAIAKLERELIKKVKR